MNAKLHFAMFFNSVCIAIRDTFEYLLVGKENVSLKGYEIKKNMLNTALKENSPFDLLVKQNAEMGEKLREQLQNLYDLVYKEGNPFIRIEDEKLVIDHSLNIKVMDLIIPLHLSFVNLTQSHYDHLPEEDKEKGCLEEIQNEKEYYYVISQYVLASCAFTDRFVEFNKTMREHKGEENIESNFIISEMTKMIQAHNWLRDNGGNEFESYKKADEIFNQCLELAGGKIKPAEGEDLLKLLKDKVEAILQILAPVEVKYKQHNQQIMKELAEFEQKIREQRMN